MSAAYRRIEKKTPASRKEVGVLFLKAIPLIAFHVEVSAGVVVADVFDHLAQQRDMEKHHQTLLFIVLQMDIQNQQWIHTRPR